MLKKSTQCLALSCAVAGSFATVAHAEAYLGGTQLFAHHFEYGDYNATGLITYRLFVHGLDEGDSVVSVSGIPGAALNVDTNGTLFNAAEHGQTYFAPEASLHETFPETQWDTWLAIGDAALEVTPDFPDLALAGTGDLIEHENAAWYNADPGSPAYEQGGSVLIGQFSFAGDEEMYFSANMQIVRADGTNYQIWLDGHFLDVPAPAALALLGIAGLTWRRRRD